MKNLTTLLAVAVLAVAVLAAGCNVQTVDVDQPVSIADKFYGALKKGDSEAALTQFSPEFMAHERQWPRLLGNLQRSYGPITAATLQQAQLASNGQDPCYLLTYATQRGPLASKERLFVCARGNTPPWLIAGHGLTRLDTQQSIAGGMMPSAMGVQAP